MEFTREHYVTEWQSDGSVLITAMLPGTHKAYWSSTATGFTDDNEIGVFETSTVVHNPLGNRRCYYHVISEHGYSVVAPRNLIPDGTSNLRDIGGYNTADMRRFVQYGLLYRSGMLSYYRDERLEYLQSLNLRQIIDLRMPEEVVQKYVDPPIAGADHINLSPLNAAEMNQFVATLDELAQLTPDRAVVAYQDVIGTYRTAIFGNAAYQRMFRLLLEGKLPLLYHCSAGKDRTGMASALILMALGIPRETIIYDYMLTNDARANLVEKLMLEFARKNDDPTVVEALGFFISVRIEAIESMFAAIDEKYDTVADFFKTELLVTKEEIEQLQRMLLVEHQIESR